MIDGRHVCMLPKPAKFMDPPPTLGWCWRMLYKLREWRLPCEWHNGSMIYLRSQQSVKRERKRLVRTNHWPVLHPYSPAKHYWDCTAMLVGFFSLIYIPMEVFKPCPTPFNYMILMADAIAFLDIVIKFMTGNERDGNKVIIDPKEIARRYLRDTFILDLISTIPFQFIEFYIGCRFPTFTTWYILKLFRLIAIGRAWKNVSHQIQMSYITTSALVTLVRLGLFIHWMAYSYYQIPILFVHFYGFKGRAKYWIDRFNIGELYDASIATKYSTSLFYVCGLIIGAGRPDSANYYLPGEQIMSSVIGLLGLLFIVYVGSTFLRLMAYSRFDMFLYDGRLKELQNYMVFKHLPNSLRRKIELFIKYKFYGHFFNEADIVNTINEQIKQDINMHCCKRLVMNVPLFQDMPMALVNSIIFKLVQVVYMPGETVMKCDQPGTSIYLIYSGTVALFNAAGREVTHLRDGTHFGEAALLNPGSKHLSTAVALEITEIFKLSNKDFQASLQPYPHLKRRIDSSAVSQHRPRNTFSLNY
ncbi:hypothetical protein evm_012198 [Chilo suppressalis]|nr:hypothetical protein evm_012198 [Chilo suppressalis]